MALERFKRNRLSLRAAPCILGMQMVSTVVNREQLRRMSRIACNRIEINHAVEFFAAENPGVDLLSHPFFLRSEESDRRPRRPQIQKRVFERCEKLKSIQEAVTLLSQCQYLRRTRAWHYCNPITVCDDYVVWIYCDAIALNVGFSAVYDVIFDLAGPTLLEMAIFRHSKSFEDGPTPLPLTTLWTASFRPQRLHRIQDRRFPRRHICRNAGNDKK
jgi:hypothetical protein